MYIHKPSHDLYVKASKMLWFGMQRRWSISTSQRVTFHLKKFIIAKIKSEEDANAMEKV